MIDTEIPIHKPEQSGYQIYENQSVDLNNFSVLVPTSNGVVNFVVGESESEKRDRLEAIRIERERFLAQKSTQGAYDIENIANANVQPEATANLYAKGNCTWWVKNQRQETPNRMGNAKNWTINSDTPEVGGVVITNESRLGHVAYIKAVEGDYIEISEMNYVGLYTVNKRVLNWHTGVIKGFLN